MTVQAGLCRTWSKTQIIGFLTHRLKFYISVQLTEDDQQFAQVPESKTLIKKRPEKWTVDEVCQWLTELGLEQYESGFRTHHIDGQELLLLDESALQKSLGIGKLEIEEEGVFYT